MTYTPVTVGMIASGGIKHANPAKLTFAHTVCPTGTHLVALPQCSDILFAGFTTSRTKGEPVHSTHHNGA